MKGCVFPDNNFASAVETKNRSDVSVDLYVFMRIHALKAFSLKRNRLLSFNCVHFSYTNGWYFGTIGIA